MHLSRLVQGCTLALMLALPGSASPVLADDDPAASAPPPPRVSLLARAWGSPVPPTINLGMWTRHVDRVGVGRSNLYGATVGGVFFATFLNSYHDRSYALAIERQLARGNRGPVGYGAGYRLGAIHGYDERMIAVAGRTPVVPFVQVLGDVTWRNRVGVQASFCVKVVTWGAIVRF